MYEYLKNQSVDIGGRKLKASELPVYLSEKTLKKLVTLKVIKKSKDGAK